MQQENLKLFAIVLFLIGFAGCKSNSLKDIEGNKYKTVSIGTQIWMSENLKTTKFNDGTEIPIVTDNEVWAKLQTPALSWYNNDTVENKKTYGALYNWYSVNTNKLCPAGTGRCARSAIQHHSPSEEFKECKTSKHGKVRLCYCINLALVSRFLPLYLAEDGWMLANQAPLRSPD